jgi:8-oxo-dGTP diphosphatase
MTTSSTINPHSLDHFFRGAFSIDIVLFTFHNGTLQILLQEKSDLPFEDKLGLPGNLILPNEDTDQALEKLLVSTIGTGNFYTKQLRAFSELGRHPLGRIISFAYYGLVPFEQLTEPLSEDLSWCGLEDLPALSLDHNEIVKQVTKRFRKGLLRHPRVFELLPEKFILSQIIAIYEQAFGRTIDKPNFRRQVLTSGLVEATGEFKKTKNSLGRPAELYTRKTMEKVSMKDKIHFNFTG